MGRTAVLAAASLLLMGCAVGGVTKQWLETRPPEPHAEIVFFRPKDALGSGLSARILMDGFVIGAIGIGQKLTLKVAPGAHITGLAEAPINVELKESDPQYYLVQLVAWSDRWSIQRLTATEAAPWQAATVEVGNKPLPESELLSKTPGR